MDSYPASHCGVVISKEQDSEATCPEPAADVVYISEDGATVIAIVLMCARHSREFDDGKMLMFKTDEGKPFIIIQGGKDATEPEPHAPESRATGTGGLPDETGGQPAE